MSTDPTTPTTEHRVMVCEACWGDGGFEENCLSIGGYDSTRWVRCVACVGKGEIEVELLSVTADDMEEASSDSFDDVKLDCFVFGRWVPETDLTEAERVAWLNETLGVSE